MSRSTVSVHAGVCVCVHVGVYLCVRAQSCPCAFVTRMLLFSGPYQVRVDWRLSRSVLLQDRRKQWHDYDTEVAEGRQSHQLYGKDQMLHYILHPSFFL